MNAQMERFAKVAEKCADHPAGARDFGAYVSSAFFAGGFAFRTVEEAAVWVDQQRSHAIRDGRLSDFSAAICSKSGQIISLYS